MEAENAINPPLPNGQLSIHSWYVDPFEEQFVFMEANK